MKLFDFQHQCMLFEIFPIPFKHMHVISICKVCVCMTIGQCCETFFTSQEISLIYKQYWLAFDRGILFLVIGLANFKSS